MLVRRGFKSTSSAVRHQASKTHKFIILEYSYSYVFCFKILLKFSKSPFSELDSTFLLFPLGSLYTLCQSSKAPFFFLSITLIWPAIAFPSGLPPTASRFNFALTTTLQSLLFVLLSFLLCRFSTGTDLPLFAFLAPPSGLPCNPGETCETTLVSPLQIHASRPLLGSCTTSDSSGPVPAESP